MLWCRGAGAEVQVQRRRGAGAEVQRFRGSGSEVLRFRPHSEVMRIGVGAERCSGVQRCRWTGGTPGVQVQRCRDAGAGAGAGAEVQCSC